MQYPACTLFHFAVNQESLMGMNSLDVGPNRFFSFFFSFGRLSISLRTWLFRRKQVKVITARSLNIYYQNVRGPGSKTDKLMCLNFWGRDYNIVTISETWLYDGIASGEYFKAIALRSWRCRKAGNLVVTEKSLLFDRVMKSQPHDLTPECQTNIASN
uniref:Uncharacterized protein n=1 Tax=Ixodes ricinus TaxID=34613 RepID=A0A6B0UX85_IXORI